MTIKRVDLGPPFGRLIIGDEGQPAEQPTRLYRIEFPNGRGPFNSVREDAKVIYDRLAEPVPGFDCTRLAKGEQCGLTEGRFYRAHGDACYACDSLDALHHWFPDAARRYLADLGAKLIEYVVPTGAPLLPIHNGEVVFDRRSAHRVAEGALA